MGLTFFLVGLVDLFLFVCFVSVCFVIADVAPFELKPHRNLYQGQSADLVFEIALMGFLPGTI